MQQQYAVAVQPQDDMTTIIRVWHTCEEQISFVSFRLYNEKIEKDNERDQNMDKIMTHLDILSKNVMAAGTHSVCYRSWE